MRKGEKKRKQGKRREEMRDVDGREEGWLLENRRETFRCHIHVVFYKLNTKYITISQNTTKIIVLCFTICFTTTCFGPFL